MKNSQSIKKLLFIDKANIALIVFNYINDEKNILFANQVKIGKADLKVKINDLLTSASNFLHLYIKDVEVIFDDPNISEHTYTESHYDCSFEAEIKKEIYKISKARNQYVNEIIFDSIYYDEVEKKADVTYKVITTDYILYKEILKAVKECNVDIVDVTNLYVNLNNKQSSSQIILKFNENKIIVAEYAIGKLIKISTLEINMDLICNTLSNKFNLKNSQILQIIKIINNMNLDTNSNNNLSLNFDLTRRQFSSLKSNEFIYAYQEEINKLISTKFNLNNYSDVVVIADCTINKLENAKIIDFNNIIGTETINYDKLLVFNNIKNIVNEKSHYKFESTLNLKVHSLVV